MSGWTRCLRLPARLRHWSDAVRAIFHGWSWPYWKNLAARIFLPHRQRRRVFPRLKRLEDRAAPVSTATPVALFSAAAVVHTAEPPEQTPDVEKPSAVADNAMSLPTVEDEKRADLVFSQTTAQDGSFSMDDDRFLAAAEQLLPSGDETEPKHTATDTQFDPVMADSNALVDPASHADTSPADGTKSDPHHAGSPMGNNVNGNPPNLAGAYAGAGQGPGGASTPFTAGGGNSGGAGAGPAAASLTGAELAAMTGGASNTATAAPSTAAPSTAPSTPTAMSRVLSPSDDIGSGTLSGTVSGGLGGSHGFMLTGSISGGLSGTFNGLGNPASGDLYTSGTFTDGTTYSGVSGHYPYQISGGTFSGTFTFSGSTSDGGSYSGSGTFSGTVDGSGNITSGTFSGNINAAEPIVANNDSYTLPHDSTLGVPAAGVLANDTDPNGLPLSAVLVSNASHGSVNLNSDGSFTYTPNAGYTGPDSFTYYATDGTANSNTASVSLTVTNTGTPVITNPGNQVDVAGTSVGLAISAKDPDGDTLTYSAVGLPPGLNIDPSSGYVSGTIADNATNGSPYTVTVTASDGVASANQTFQWAVNPIGLANPGDQINSDGDVVSLPVTANTASGQPLTYNATGLPLGLGIDPNSGLISGTIAANADSGNPYTTTVTVSDGTNQTSQSFSWYVGQPAAAPSLDQPGDRVNAAGDAVLLQLTATASSNLSLTYSATGLPDGLSVDSSTGLISGTIAADAARDTPYQVMATVSDGINTDSQTFWWTVNYVGLTNPGDQFNNDSDTVSLAIQANGASGSLTYSATGLPPDLNIDPNSGLISGTIAANADTGSPYTTTVTVTDGTHYDSQSFSWYVGQPPVLSLDQPDDQINAAGDTVSLQLSATDWNTPLLTYSAMGLPDGLSVDPGTGLISGTIANDGASDTPHQVTVSVSDGTNTVSQTFQWTVNYVGLANPGDQFNNDGESVSLSLTANDASGQTLTYSAMGLPPDLNIDPSSGLISGTITANADTSSPYTTTVTVSDGTHQANQTFSWYVSPQPSLSLDPPGNQVNAAGDVVALELSALDSSLATLTYSATGLPDGLSVDPSTGIISGTIANDAASNTPYQVTASVSDGTNTVSQTFLWAVNYIGLDAIGDQDNLDGDTVSLSISASDASGRLVTFSATGLPPGLSINPQSGLVSGTIAAAADTSSPYTVTVTASDGMYNDSQTFQWNVSPQPPLTLADPGDQVNATGDTVSLPLTATDAAGNPVTYSATGLPDGLTINSSTGIISGTVAADAVSDTPYVVTVTASDGTNTVSQTFGWRVTAQGAPQTDVPGDTLVTAEPTQFDTSGMAQFDEVIGDNSYGSMDVDLYAVQMAAGDSFTLTNQVSAAMANNDPNFGIAVRIFDSAGNELANAGENGGLQDGDTVNFTAQTSGTYYIGISYFGNTAYNPQAAGSGVAGIVGAYSVMLNFAPAQEKVAEQWQVTRDLRYDYAVVQAKNLEKDTITGLAKLIGLQPQGKRI